MKKITKMIALMLALACICTAFAACGGNTDSGDNTKAPAVKVIEYDLTDEEYAFGVDKNQPELLKQVNDIIKQMKADGTFEAICNKYFGDGTPVAVKSAKYDESKDQLVVATNAEFEPFEYTKGDSYYGIDMEMAAYIADKLGKELVINNMDFNAVCLSVGQHKCDIAMTGLTVSEARKEYVTFTDSYYSASQRVIVKGTDTIFDSCKSADEVAAILSSLGADKKIGCQQGSTAQSYIEGSEDLGFAGLTAKAVTYSNSALAVQDLINGGVDFVIVDSAPAASITAAINEVA